MDVHIFDGHWSHDIKTNISMDDKCKLFNSLYRDMTNLHVDSNSLKGLFLVVENTQKESNYDPINKIYSDDILAEICQKIVYMSSDVEKHDTIMNISEQLSDMYLLGQCPQGRSTRLIQIYNCLSK